MRAYENICQIYQSICSNYLSCHTYLSSQRLVLYHGSTPQFPRGAVNIPQNAIPLPCYSADRTIKLRQAESKREGSNVCGLFYGSVSS
jgi:hypothetical protein